jgi:predicted oxidoreductase
MAQRKIRDQIFVATKYTTNFKMGKSDILQKTHYTGNNIKSMRVSVDASLMKLRTEYIGEDDSASLPILFLPQNQQFLQTYSTYTG